MLGGLHQRPYGGHRRIYHQVDVLNRKGFDAHVVHGRAGHRLNWFPNETRVLHAPLTLGADDILVIPEVYREATYTAGPGIRRVSLNLNIFNWLPPDVDQHTLMTNATICNSEYAHSLLSQTLPGHPVDYVPHGIVSQDYSLKPEKKQKIISFMPRKDPIVAKAVAQLLRASEQLRDWTLLEIDGMPEQEVISHLQSSELFLAFGRREGFGRPPVEAIACGASVIGFTGVAGTEYFETTAAEEIRDGDVLEFVRAVKDWVARFNVDPDAVHEQQLVDSRVVLETYSLEREQQALVKVFQRVANQSPSQLGARRITLKPTDINGSAAHGRLRRAGSKAKKKLTNASRLQLGSKRRHAPQGTHQSRQSVE